MGMKMKKIKKLITDLGQYQVERMDYKTVDHLVFGKNRRYLL
jgi:hypothetical protein